MIARLLFIASAICFGLFLAGCAPGVDGLRQTCANTDVLLTGGYQLATASMKSAEQSGTAKRLLGCFEDLVAALDAASKIKEASCDGPSGTASIASDVGAVFGAGTNIAAAMANWKTCSATALLPGG